MAQLKHNIIHTKSSKPEKDIVIAAGTAAKPAGQRKWLCSNMVCSHGGLRPLSWRCCCCFRPLNSHSIAFEISLFGFSCCCCCVCCLYYWVELSGKNVLLGQFIISLMALNALCAAILYIFAEKYLPCLLFNFRVMYTFIAEKMHSAKTRGPPKHPREWLFQRQQSNLEASNHAIH